MAWERKISMACTKPDEEETTIKTRQEKALLGTNYQVSCSNFFLNNIFSYIVFGGWGRVFVHFEQRPLKLRGASPLR